MKANLLYFVFLFSSVLCFSAEENLLNLGPLKIQNINGKASIEGGYRNQRLLFKDGSSENQEQYILKGVLNGEMKSYIWHQNFLKLNLGFIYSPDTRKYNYLVIPDKAESSNEERITIGTILFDNKPIRLNMNFNKGYRYVSRNLGSSYKSTSTDYFAGLSLSNKILPIAINYSDNKTREEELLSDRYSAYHRRNLSANASKVLFSNLTNTFSASLEDFYSDNSGLTSLNIFSTDVKVNNNFLFNLTDQNGIFSAFSFLNQNGSINQKIITENLSFRYKLPFQFSFSGNYRYNNTSFSDSMKSVINNLDFIVDHQLYQSLHSYLLYQYFNADHLTSEETRNIFGFGFNYSKNIYNGRLYIDYDFHLDRNSMDRSKINNSIINEEHTIDDTKALLLRYPKVILSSIRIRDKVNSVIYQQDIDYFVEQRGEFVEIRRNPGGLLFEGKSIYIDYICQNPFSYSYNLIANSLSTRVSLFDRLFEIYTRILSNSYSNVIISDPEILNRINQKLFGVQSSYRGFEAGAELDFYESNIMPYKNWRIYAHYSSTWFNKLQINILSEYKNVLYTELKELNKFYDVNLKLMYLINFRSRASIDMNYVNHQARGVTNGYFSTRGEYIFNYSQLYIIFGVEYFDRRIDLEKSYYKNIYLKIERQF